MNTSFNTTLQHQGTENRFPSFMYECQKFQTEQEESKLGTSKRKEKKIEREPLSTLCCHWSFPECFFVFFLSFLFFLADRHAAGRLLTYVRIHITCCNSTCLIDWASKRAFLHFLEELVWLLARTHVGEASHINSSSFHRHTRWNVIVIIILFSPLKLLSAKKRWIDIRCTSFSNIPYRYGGS